MYTKAFRILLIEDNPGDARLVELMLNEDSLWGHVDIRHERSLANGIDRLENETADLVLLDLSLPDSSGLETLQRLQEHTRDVPIVVLTGQEDEQLGIDAVKKGAQDFLSKNGLTGSLLGRSIRYAYERRQTERELRSSEERFRKTFENAPIGMATANMDMQYTRVNTALCDFIGYSEEELVGMSFDEVSYPEDVDETRKSAERLMQGMVDSFQIEKRYIHKNGHLVWGLLNLTIVQLGENRFFLGQIRDINEQKITEEKLRSSERRYRALFNSANDEILVFQLDDQHKALPFMEVNDFACRQLGYTREELLQMKISDIVAASPEDLNESLRRLIKNREMVLKTHHIAKNGRHIPTEVNAHLFELNNRATVMVIGRDITERIKAERSLRKERNFVSAIVDTAGALIVVLDHSGRIVRFNPACEEMTGYSADEIQGQRFDELLLVEEEIDQVKEIFDMLSRGDYPVEHENFWVTKDGQLRRINWSNTCIYNEDGEVEFIIAIGNDVTERRKVERALQESEVKYRAIVETTAEAIITVDPNGRVESFNSAAEKIFDYEREQILGKDFMQLVAPSYRAEQLERLALLQAEEELESGDISEISELKGLRSNGSEFHMEMSVNRVNLNGRILITCILRDITERRQLEKQILEISDKEKRRIGQDLHDGLGQMLTGIQLITKSLARKLKDEAISYEEAASEADEVANLMHEADEQARGLARGLVPVDLDQDGLILAMRRLTNNSERMFGIQCKFDEFLEVPIESNGTAIHLYRIAQEAISNAYKHGKATEIQVVLASSEESIRLRIQDNGRGFPDKLEATGMGVKIMNYRARLIGGYLNISRDLMGHTIITCTVPRTAESEDHIKEEQVNNYEKDLNH